MCYNGANATEYCILYLWDCSLICSEDIRHVTYAFDALIRPTAKQVRQRLCMAAIAEIGCVCTSNVNYLNI